MATPEYQEAVANCARGLRVWRQDHLDGRRTFHHVPDPVSINGGSWHELIVPRDRITRVFVDCESKEGTVEQFNLKIDELVAAMAPVAGSAVMCRANRRGRHSTHITFERTVPNATDVYDIVRSVNVHRDIIDFGVYPKHGTKTLRTPGSYKVESGEYKYPLVLDPGVAIDRALIVVDVGCSTEWMPLQAVVKTGEQPVDFAIGEMLTWFRNYTACSSVVVSGRPAINKVTFQFKGMFCPIANTVHKSNSMYINVSFYCNDITATCHCNDQECSRKKASFSYADTDELRKVLFGYKRV